jgi:hypothetical protein
MQQDKPEPLAQAEEFTKQQVNNNVLRHNPERAFAFWEAAYHDFASTHSKEDAQKYLTDTAAYIKSHGLMPDMTAAFGVELKKDQASTPGTRISSAEMKQIESSSDPFKALLATELQEGSSDFMKENNKSTMEGGMWVTHWGGHPVDGVGIDDLNHHLDQFESYERATKLQRDLLTGNSNSVFNKVAEYADKNPEVDELYHDDFQNFYNATQKKLASEQDVNQKAELTRQLDVTGRVLQNWNEASLNFVADSNQTPTHVSKREMGVGHDVQELYGQRVDGLVYRSADVLNSSGIFETVAGERRQSPDTVRITAGDIDDFLTAHGRDLNRYQYGVMREIVNHLSAQPKYWVLGLIGDVDYDQQGNGHLTFSKTSIEHGQYTYLDK